MSTPEQSVSKTKTIVVGVIFAVVGVVIGYSGRGAHQAIVTKIRAEQAEEESPEGMMKMGARRCPNRGAMAFASLARAQARPTTQRRHRGPLETRRSLGTAGREARHV